MDYLLLIYNLIRAIFYPAGIRWLIIPACIICLGLDTYAMYRLFALTNDDEKKAFIPFINVMTLYRIAWERRFGIFCCLAEALYGVLSLLSIGLIDHPALKVPAAICIIIAYILQILMKAKLARCFAKDEAMTYGLIFL